MQGIFPVPTGRTSNQMVQQRLLAQMQFDQRQLLQLQDQLSTGQRITAPSQDAPAALRAIGLQRLLGQKEQIQQNLASSQSYLNVTDNAISSAAHLLAEVRGIAVSAADSSSSDSQREAASHQILRSIDQLVQLANQNFRGRFLFAGSSSTSQPFHQIENFIAYQGNDGSLSSFADLDLLLQSNVPGQQVFGAISTGVQGTADLTPILTGKTRLTDLHGGLGVQPGSLVISDGTNSRTIDLSTAHTLADVVRLIESQPPTGRTMTARIEEQGLVLEIDAEGGGTLNVREAAGGKTAAELGILAPQGTGGAPLVGGSLKPRLQPTTALAHLPVELDLEAGIQIVNGGKTFTLRFDEAVTVEDVLNQLNNSGAQVLAEINAAGTGINIRSRLSGGDFHIGENGGNTATQLGIRSFTGQTSLAELNHGRGVDRAEGTDLVIRRQDGVELAVDLSSAYSMGDVIDRINQHPDNQGGSAVVARLARFGNGMELVDANPAGATTLAVTAARGSRAAWDLGLIPAGQDQAEATAAGAEAAVLVGSDPHPLETQGVFNSLIRLNDALLSFDQEQIQRAVALLEADFHRIDFTRSELGARQQGLDALQQRHENEQVELQSMLSHEVDVDMVQVISQLTARQASWEASLRLSGRIFQTSLLDFV